MLYYDHLSVTYISLILSFHYSSYPYYLVAIVLYILSKVRKLLSDKPKLYLLEIIELFALRTYKIRSRCSLCNLDLVLGVLVQSLLEDANVPLGHITEWNVVSHLLVGTNSGDGIKVLLRQFNLSEILDNPVSVVRLGNRGDATLDGPCKKNVGRRDSELLGQSDDSRVVCDFCGAPGIAAQWTVSSDMDVLLFTVGKDLVLGKIWMHLKLMDRWDDAGASDNAFYVLDLEV